MPGRQEPWGGEVRVPRLLEKLLRRQEGPGDTPERAHERHKPEPPARSVAGNADRAVAGPLSDLYREGRGKGR